MKQEEKTSQERPKSAQYLRLKNVIGGPFVPFETPVCCKIFKKIKDGPFGDFKKISGKNFLNEISEQCLSAEKYKRGTPWDFLTSIVF